MERGKRLLDQFVPRATNGPQSWQSRGKLSHSAFALLGQPHRLLARPQTVILASRQPTREIQRRFVNSSVVFILSLHSRQDEWRARFIDEDAVRLVDDREMQTAQQQRSRLPSCPGLEKLVDE